MLNTTGGVIKYLRKRSGLSQEELGEILGVKRGTIHKYENNTITLNADAIKKLCRVFGTPPWVFIFPEEETTRLLIDDVEDYYAKFYSLNHAGRMKVNDYISDLYEIKAYRCDD